jgi:protein-L-isoaspartate(D-aspartate) O-methyltransferase
MNELDEPERRMRFVLNMRTAGVTDARVLSALEVTPRAHFAPKQFAQLALDDVDLPIEGGQMMTKPSVVGRMLSALGVSSDDGVLEIGLGSGFQTAVLAALARRVTALDRRRALVVEARAKLAALALPIVRAHVGDGRLGFAANAPYERIIVNAAAVAAPLALIDQLAPNGVLVAPIGEGEKVRLMRFTRGAGAPEDLGPIRFGPLEDGLAEEA